MGLIAFVLMAIGIVAVAAPASASSMPPTDWSYYVTKLDTSTAATLGCNQGKYDASHGNVDSTATLDFGGQNSGNTGTYLTFSDTSVSYSAIESYAKNFAYNYWICTGSDTTSYLTMSLGTNNSAYYVNSTGGASWAAAVNNVISYMNNYGQVTTWGANDMELDWAGYSATASWESGYAGHTSALYNDYGDAAGCPPYGSCDNGWTQHDVYQVAWGDAPAEATPEIYYTSQGNEWVSVSNNQGRITFWAPWDEYDLDNSTLTAAGAWSALQCDGSQSCLYSMQIHKAS